MRRCTITPNGVSMVKHHYAKDIAKALYASVGSPYALEKLNALESGDLSSIAKSKISPSAYDSSYTFSRDYACHNFLRKYVVTDDVTRLTLEATQSFLAIESRLAILNHRLDTAPCKNGVEGIISYARRKIASILGRFDLNEFERSCGWGPGATSTLKGKDGTLDKKILEPRLSITCRALVYAKCFNQGALLWNSARLGMPVTGPLCLLRSEYHVTESGRFTTVPKDMGKRRSIDIQPTANLFFQKGAGKMIRVRLYREGINLDDQARNQYLASRAFLDGLATIDLEAASDSVSTALVRLLVPPEWYRHLDALRTHRIDINGLDHRLEKFSAMGNGFTFELESLIFYALSWAVVRAEGDDYNTPIAVYGDDIVVSSVHYKRLTEVLSEVGFIVNDTKSFHEGPFYESCGKHYFKGIDVTPPFQKEAIEDSVSAIRCANRLWRWAYRMAGNEYLDDVARSPYEMASRIAEDFFSRPFEVRRKRKQPLPTQPWWLEGDGGLIVNRAFSFDMNGIAKLDLFRNNPNFYQDCSGAVYGDSMRNSHRRGRIFDTSDSRYDVCSFTRNLTSSDFVPRPCYGRVTPRGVNSWIIVRQRVYCQTREVPIFEEALPASS